MKVIFVTVGRPLAPFLILWGGELRRRQILDFFPTPPTPEGLWLSPEHLSPVPSAAPFPPPRSVLHRTARAILLAPDTMQFSAENDVMSTAFTQS